MKIVLKNSDNVFQKGNYHFRRNKTKPKMKKFFRQESLDFFASNVIKDMPFMSNYITFNYNKYILNRHRDRFFNIKNFLSFKNTTKADIDQAFEKLNSIRLKISLLERDILTYRNALKYSFDAKDNNRILQKRILKKYSKLRKYDTYQNLTLGIIYDNSILSEKIKVYEKEANKVKEKINNKYDTPEALTKMQKEFIYSIIYKRQITDKIFEEDVELDTLKELLKQNPRFKNQLSNIDTFTNDYLHNNAGSLSKAFVKFKSEHKKSNINSVVQDYLRLYANKYPDTTNDTLNKIQRELLSSFTYKDFKRSDIFGEMDRAINLNEILLKAKTNFAKMQICQELEFCLNLPEINNYFKILDAKDEIPNYVVSTERLFVERIESEFPEIKTSSFIYLYNKVKSTLDKYRTDIVSTEQFFVADFINAVIVNEFEDPKNKKAVKDTLQDIVRGVYKNQASIDAKFNLDLYSRLITQFSYIKLTKKLEFEQKIQDCKLFHGVLVTSEMKPILPLNIQQKIINLPIDAQINLAVNYNSNLIFDLLDEFYITESGELKKGREPLFDNPQTNLTIKQLSLHQLTQRVEEYQYYNKENYYLEEEVKLAKYIENSYNGDLQDSYISQISTVRLEYSDYDYLEDDEEKEEVVSIPQQAKLIEEPLPDLDSDNNSEEITAEERKLQEVINYKNAKKYIDIILDEKQQKTQSKMLLAIQKRINSYSLPLTEVQIANLNEDLAKINLSLRTPRNYVDHLVNKYKTDGRDINSLQVGLKLRVRVGHLVLSDEEIAEINEAYNFELVQKPKLRNRKEKAILQNKYVIKIKLPKSISEKIKNSEALVRKYLKKKNGKVTPLDIKLFEILSEN